MKARKMMKCLMAVLLFCISASPVLAQKNIDKLVKQLEKRSDVSVNSVTKRDPKTKKIVSQVKTYSVKDMRQSFVKAFEMDEEDAITAIKDLPQGRMDIKNAKLTFVFAPKEDELRTYTLTVNREGLVTLTIVIKQGKDARDVSFWDVDILRERNQEVRRARQMLRRRGLLKDEMGCVVSKK